MRLELIASVIIFRTRYNHVPVHALLNVLEVWKHYRQITEWNTSKLLIIDMESFWASTVSLGLE